MSVPTSFHLTPSPIIRYLLPLFSIHNKLSDHKLTGGCYGPSVCTSRPGVPGTPDATALNPTVRLKLTTSCNRNESLPESAHVLAV